MDTLTLIWPDTLLLGFAILGTEPPVEVRPSREGLVLKIEPGETVRVFVKSFGNKTWRLYRIVEDTAEDKEGETKGEDVLTGSKTVGVSVGSEGVQLTDLTSIRLSGEVSGVKVEGFIEESGFSGSEFTAALEELDRAEIRATRGQVGFSLGNLREEVLGSQLRFLGVKTFSDWGEAWAGYEPGSFKAIELSGERGQGPYFLTEEGETVVPGSERVFLNGRLLGSEEYELDPYSGTLVFSPSLLVKPDDRIVVELEVMRGGIKRYFAAGKAQLGDFWVEGAEVREEAEGFEGADTLQGPGWVSGARFVGEGQGSYELEDSVFVFVGRGRGSWEVSFSWVGEGQGSYEYNSYLGGYEFVGRGQGSWEPIIKAWPPAEERHGGLGFSRGALSGFLRGSWRNPNRLGSFPAEEGLWASGSWAPSWGKWGLSLRAELRSELYRAFGRGFSGEEVRRWGAADRGSGEKEVLEGRLSYSGLYAEAGFFKLGDFKTLGWGAGYEGPAFLRYRQTERGFLRVEGGVRTGRGELSVTRERDEVLDLWMGEGSLSFGKFNLGGMAAKKGEVWSLAFNAGVQLQNLDGSYQLRWDTTRLEHHLKAQARWGSFWLSPELRVYGDYLKEERFVYVGDGLGDYSYDPETGQFYPDPGGAYVRQIVYLRPGETAVERAVEGGGSAGPLSGSAWFRERPDYREEGFGLWARGLRASWSQTRDQWRSWTQGEAKLWKPGRVEPFVEAKLRDGLLFGAAEARLGAAREGAGPAAGRVWLWPEGGLWELGAVANSQWLVKGFALSLNGEAFWRWGEEGPPASESLYPTGFGYFLSATARWRGLSASVYLRGKGLQLERKRLSFSLSVEF